MLWAIILSMENVSKVRRYGLDKIVLLVLLFLAVFIADIITTRRNVLVFSEPVELGYAGLSVCVPAGNGWVTERQWQYLRDSFVLTSFLRFGGAGSASTINCRYKLAAENAEPQELLARKANSIQGTIVETGDIRILVPQKDSTGTQNGNMVELPVNWAHIKGNVATGKVPVDVFFACVDLAFGHQLEFTLHNFMDDVDESQKIFLKTIESLKLNGNKLLDTGSEIVSKVKRAGLKSLINRKGYEYFFLITKGQSQNGGQRAIRQKKVGSPVGFVMDVAVAEGPNIHGINYFYVQGSVSYQRLTFFEGEDNFGNFAWKTRSTARPGGKEVEAIIHDGRVLTVRDDGPAMPGEGFSPGSERTYRFGSAAIPDLLGTMVIEEMIKTGTDRIVLDVISDEGRILPVLICKIKDNKTNEKADYEFELKILDGRNFFQRIYLDKNAEPIGYVAWQDEVFVFERTDEKQVLRAFPEQADYVLQKNKILKKTLFLEQDLNEPIQ